ncbi:olfactory receptor 10ag1-like [Lynx pardinus]|uniref:Olfactory receptor 10ag1-like n=1 Tax=Lynx pardinus TaxID=191816 RepID=A0A485NMX8_LYNPA|nr:olfactory receptor 10ag1-like [Lynx pardinus]
MSGENDTSLEGFILLGLADTMELQIILFLLFFVIYALTVLGNVGMILLIGTDSRLHTPMYFFLANLSFVDVCYSSAITPKMLADLLSETKTISFTGCFLQLYFFIALATTECILFGLMAYDLMAYDRYVAICNPLHYPLVMNHKICVQMVVACWITGVPVETGQTYQIFSLPFCGSNQINHFFCDIPPLLKLACGDTFLNEMLVFTVAVLFVTIPFLLILGSYIKIISTILRLPSATGRTKAFSTCSSHITVVVMFFGSAIITYLRPKSKHSSRADKFLSLFYTIVTPMFNPMIYTLRNKDAMMALRKLVDPDLAEVGRLTDCATQAPPFIHF